MIIVSWCCSRKGQPHPAAYRGVDCGSAWNVTWWKKAWMRACRAPSAHQANVSIREYKKGGGAPNPHLASITVSCPSPRPISSHYRPMWIPGKFLRPNFFRPIDSIWPGSFDVLSVNIMVIGYYHPHSTVDFLYVHMLDRWSCLWYESIYKTLSHPQLHPLLNLQWLYLMHPTRIFLSESSPIIASPCHSVLFVIFRQSCWNWYMDFSEGKWNFKIAFAMKGGVSRAINVFFLKEDLRKIILTVS